MDCVSPLCDDYADKAPFPFTGTFESVTFTFGEFDEPSGMDRLELATKMD
jgi:arylsulfatase